MHIAIIRKRFNPYGGAERFILRSMHSLRKAGIHFSIISESWKTPQKDEGSNSSPWIPTKLGGRTRIGKYIQFQKSCSHIIQSNQFDLVQSHEKLLGVDIYRAGDGVHASWINRLKKIKPWYHKLRLTIDPFHNWIMWYERRMAKDPKITFVSNSPMVSKELVNYYAIPSNRIITIENGIDITEFTPPTTQEKVNAKIQLGFDPLQPLILFLGCGFERKGAFELVEAMNHLDTFQLLLVGQDKKFKRLQKQINSLENQRNTIKLIPAENDIQKLLSASDIFCLPSLYDSLPNALLENICCAIPAVITENIGIANDIEQAKAGVICTRDPQNIAKSISKVWDDYANYSANALELSKKYDIAIANKKWLDLYRRLTN
jgi:UDP-glucose:(heptosyl)LPS alpha-1,3-glucosyltransferase